MLASLGAWCLLDIYWRIEARNSSPAASSESRGARRWHLVITSAAQILIFLPVPGLRLRLLPVSPIFIAAGLALNAVGLLLAVWARRCLGRYWSGKIAIKVEHRLVRSGPYRAVRHPIYTALLTLYTGTAIVSGELHALIGLALVVFAYLRKVRLEEANLIAAFGPEYRAWQGESWALFPGLF
jgi:protein-S-isoprenylcysteine O-methyltransferase Ste14